MSTISVRTHFAAGHRILGLPGPGAKCSNIHGHTFHVRWTFQQNAGDMGLEFGALKASLRGLITDHFDHGFFVHEEDVFLTYLADNGLKFYALTQPPTTEAIALEIAVLTKGLWPEAPLMQVALDEGPDNVATWEAS